MGGNVACSLIGIECGWVCVLLSRLVWRNNIHPLTFYTVVEEKLKCSSLAGSCGSNKMKTNRHSSIYPTLRIFQKKDEDFKNEHALITDIY